jgi:predicted phage-related endonuclease
MNQNGITGDDVPDVFNLSPYGCARRLYFQKIGEKPIDPCSYNDEQHQKRQIAYFGDFVANTYAKKTKRNVRKTNQDFINPRYPFIIGDTDRLQTNLKHAKGSFVPLELRILSRIQFYDIRKNGLPEGYYNYQLHHQMIAKGATWASLGVFCPDVMEMLTFDIVYDESTAAEVINAERAFWNAVMEKKTPESIARKSCELCGYCHKCYNEDYVNSRTDKEALELIEAVDHINHYLYLKEK